MNDETLPRVTVKDIDLSIVSIDYFRKSTLTIAVVTMKNGFLVTGESACAHPDLYDKSLGETLALQNARSKIWPLLGYVLREKLFQQETGDWKTRLIDERTELDDRLFKLDQFITGGQCSMLSEIDRNDLMAQANAMRVYQTIVIGRLKRLGLA